MRHGYTNSTTAVGDGVHKVYAGPDADRRAAAELAALTRLAGTLPVPAVLERHEDGSVLTELLPGRHGQELLDEGHAEVVLAACGRVLRRLHDLRATLLVPGDHPPGHVIVHGDFGPNNALLDVERGEVTALLDWEFSGVGPAILDLAWCEWIVRTHHPGATGALEAFFDAYGARPSWHERQATMVERCRWLEDFARRWDPDGAGVRVWVERVRVTAGWTEHGPGGGRGSGRSSRR